MERQTFIQEMSVNFNLRNRNTDRPTAIFAVVYLQGKQYKFPTGVKVYPHQWNKRKQHAILSLQLTELDNLNNKLCNEALNRYRNNFEDFKTAICTDTSKFENITKYLHSYMSTPSKKKKTKTEIPPLVYMKDRVRDKKTYLSAFNQFEKWLRSKKITLSNWSDLTLKTIQDYNSYIMRYAHYSPTHPH